MLVQAVTRAVGKAVGKAEAGVSFPCRTLLPRSGKTQMAGQDEVCGRMMKGGELAHWGRAGYHDNPAPSASSPPQ